MTSKSRVDMAVLLSRLASGEHAKAVAYDLGISKSGLTMRMSRYMRERGFKTTAQAVAAFAVERDRKSR